MRVGEKLGRYELLEQLGKGAAGTVFRARDALLGIDVCVKILHSGLATQPGIIERFKRELLLARRIAHPGICKIFDIQEADGTHFLTMEYVKGETLSTMLNRDGQMPVKDAVRIMRKVSEALGAAHKAGVVHRDVKPGNIIIGADGRVTIVDFGVATAEDLDRLTRAGVVLGSRSYMAPETWQGRPATAAGDVWALGVILYGCVTGRLPYKGEGVVGVFEAIKTTKPIPPGALNDEVTPELEELIFKAMCVDLERRFPDATAVEAALATLELTLGDDASPTVVRPPTFAAPAEPKPALAEERLHRPGAQPLPRPPPSTHLPSTRELSRAPPKPTEEISPLGDEMSLYAPKDTSLLEGGVLTGEQQEPTRVVGPLPGLPRGEDISAESVADAFDAAFGPPPSPSSLPASPPPPSPAAAQPATVVVAVPPGLAAPADAPAPAVAQPAAAAPSPLDFGTLPNAPEAADPGGGAQEGAALDTLVGRELGLDFRDDKTALTETPASLFPAGADDDLAVAAADATHVTMYPPLAEDVSVLPDATLPGTISPLDDEDISPRSRGPDKRLLAAGVVVVLAVVAGVVVALSGGGDDEATVATASATVPEAEAALVDEAKQPDPPPASDDGQPASAEANADLASAAVEGANEDGAGDEAAARDEVAGDHVASGEPASDDEGAGDDSALAAAAADEAADETGDEAADETGDEAADESGDEVVAASDEEPSEAVQTRKQRPSPQAAARAAYKRKRAALNAALAKKGVLPGDVPAIDGKRRQMTQALRRRDYARAADAADDALRELAKVKVDAAFVGQKLARFNQGYDRTTDEGLRARLKDVLKEIGSDYSKGRYDDANRKLNRAFSLMGR